MDANIQKYGENYGIWPTLAHISDHAPIFVQGFLKSHRCGIQSRFNLDLFQREDTKQHLLDAWKHGMEENVDQKVGLKVARALQLIKRESDYITKNLKTQGKPLYMKINLQILMSLR